MLNQRLAVVRAATTGLVGVEKQIDDLIVAQSKLTIELIEGRRSANLPLTTGQHGLNKLAEAQALMIAARAAVNEAHYSLRDARDDLRLPVHAYGDTGDTPDDRPQRASLALVDAA